jgi:hypothetical protein
VPGADPAGGAALRCAHCGRTGDPAEAAAGWTISRRPRPVGRTAERTEEERRATALCPDCSRRHLRDLEARLDP